MSNGFFARVHGKAHAAGMAAGQAAVPQPVTFVVDSTSEFISRTRLASGVEPGDEGGERFYEPEGLCGFAWINVKDARRGYAKWAIQQGIATHDSYLGGATIWVSEFGQSVARKEAYATAYAAVLYENGIVAMASSRLD